MSQFIELSDESIGELVDLIIEMGWDYDRFSSSGKSTYNKIEEILNG